MDVKYREEAAPSKKVAQGLATRSALAEAARLEFGERGYDETTVDDIVARAGVTKGAFYHHFRGKRDVFLLVFEEVQRELSRAAFITHVEHEPFVGSAERWKDQTTALRHFLTQTDEEVWDELRERCRRFVELHTAPAIQRIVLSDGHAVLTWQERQRVEAEHGLVLLRADLRRAMRRGLISRLPLRTLSVLLSGALGEACLLVANADDREGSLEDAMTVIGGFLEGIRTKG